MQDPTHLLTEKFAPSSRNERRRQDAHPECAPLRRHDDRIYALWDALADFGADSTSKALAHCMRTISDWIGAQAAFWVGAVRMGTAVSNDPLLGWRLGRTEVLGNETTSEAFLRTMRELRTEDLGETSRAVAAGAGRFRAHSLGTGLVDMDTFRQTSHYDRFYAQTGVVDRIWVVFPVNVDAESYFVFDTYTEGRAFSRREIYLAAEALRGIKWFHRQQLLRHGLGISGEPLTPRERRILPGLLSGAVEAAIAADCGLSPGTVHQYLTRIYRKFGVRGRAEFMALWLRGRLQTPAI